MNLLEVMVAFTALIIFSLSFIKLQLQSMQTLQSCYHISFVATQASSLKQRLQLNRDYDFKNKEFNRWRAEIAEVLPDTQIALTQTANGLKIILTWKEYFSNRHYRYEAQL